VETRAGSWLASKQQLKPKTRATYESLLRTCILPDLGRVPLGRLDPVMIAEWVAGLTARGLGASRVRQAYTLLSGMLTAAVAGGYIARSPCVGVELPRLPHNEMLFLTAEQVHTLAGAAGRDRLLVEVLAYCGLRWGEAVGLRRRRCDLLRGRLEVVEALVEVNGRLHWGPPKTHQIRSVVLPGFLREPLAVRLAEIGDPDGVEFTGPQGGPLRSANFRQRAWQPALERAGLPERLRIHDLRHTCASLLIAQGADAKDIQHHLGHSSIQVTMDRYGHLLPDRADRLAEALDAAYRDAAQRPAAPLRPQHGPKIVQLAERGH
jgi:integrase